VRVGVLGLGEMGLARAACLMTPPLSGLVELVAVSDSEPRRREQVPGTAFLEPGEFLTAPVDLAVVCLPHEAAVDATAALLDRGIRVLVEKPLGRTHGEALALTRRAADGQLHVGFNYRFLAPLAALVADATAGALGEIVAVEIEFGHGGSPADRTSWKLDPIVAGGGVLLDPGVHVLDLVAGLARGLGHGRLTPQAVLCSRPFWQTGIEEHAEVLLSDESATVYRIGISLMKWRSTFRVLVSGTEGYGEVTGRSRSYGPQEYRRGQRWGWQSAASQRESEVVVARAEVDDSLASELRAVVEGAAGSEWARTPATGQAACEVMGLYEQVKGAIRWA